MDTATLMIWYLCYNNQLYHYTWLDTTISMLWHWYSYLAYYFGNNWLSKLPYNLMILLENLIHYYTTMNTTTLMIWYFRYNNQLYYYTWLDTTIFTYNTWYNNKYTYMMILDTAISILWYLIQQSQLLLYNNDSASFPMPLWYSWYKTQIIYILQQILQP